MDGAITGYSRDLAEDAGDSGFRVRDVKRTAEDESGAIVRTIYAKAVPYYAVYSTDERLVVQYADPHVQGTTGSLASEQRKALAPLAAVRGEINGLIDQWRSVRPDLPQEDDSDDQKIVPPRPDLWSLLWASLNGKARRWRDFTAARRYDRRGADALVVALQGDVEQAAQLLERVKSDIVAERASLARIRYLFAAALTMCVVLTTILVATGVVIPNLSDVSQVTTVAIWRGGAIGAVGALFSIALKIRSREDIGTGLEVRDNIVDAILRVMIGATSGVLILCLLAGGFLTIKLGNDDSAFRLLHCNSLCRVCGGAARCPATPGMTSFAVLLAFAAGFTERLASDLIANFSGAIGTRSTPQPSAVVGAARAQAAAAANERNPLGVTPPVAPPAAQGNTEGDAENHLDHCGADTPLAAGEVTEDQALPAAEGGIASGALPGLQGGGSPADPATTSTAPVPPPPAADPPATDPTVPQPPAALDPAAPEAPAPADPPAATSAPDSPPSPPGDAASEEEK